MSGNTIEVADGIWQWVLSSVMLSDENHAKLQKWMNGEKSPTFNQLEGFSKKTRIPLGYFFLKTPPKEPIGVRLADTMTTSSIVKTSDIFNVYQYLCRLV